MSSLKKNTEYDSSKTGLYLNAAVVVFAIIFTVAALVMTLNFMLLMLYFGLSIAVTLLMYKIKLLLASKMQGQLPDEEQTENKARIIKWNSILILSVAITIALILPVILVLVLDPASWFVSFTSIATGMGLSEIVLYRSTMNQGSGKDTL